MPLTSKSRELASECRKPKGNRLNGIREHTLLRAPPGGHRADLLTYSQRRAGHTPSAVCTRSLSAAPGSPALIFHPSISRLGLAVCRLGFQAFAWASACTETILPAGLGLRSRP